MIKNILRVKSFEDKVITKLTENEVLKGNTHYSCIAAIYVGSIRKLEKENYPQVNLEQCNCILKKRKTLIYLMMN